MLGLFHGQLMWFAFICGQSHSKKIIDSALIKNEWKEKCNMHLEGTKTWRIIDGKQEHEAGVYSA